MKRLTAMISAVAALGASVGAAQAHTAGGHVHGFTSGFMHPLTGVDHLVMMVAIGFLAALMGGRARWALPMSFAGMMIVGGVLGAYGIGLPFVEPAILLSLVAVPVAIAMNKHLNTAAATVFVALFAIFHGHAHGSEMPELVSGLTYGAGFVFATVLLHAAGLFAGFLAMRAPLADSKRGSEIFQAD